MRMQLTRLRVEQLRQFRQPFELAGLQPGLNIWSGANEAGKSTLVRAIRAAFFERHRSQAVDDLLPWGDSGAAPGIELDFVLGEQQVRLHKSFMARKRCTLQLDGAQLEGAEAEEWLAAIFGFAFAGKGASRSEHWGIPGLLWVEQGSGQELQGPAQHAREHLHDALKGLIHGPEAESGLAALAATDGDALLERFKTERAELLTATGKPRLAYAEAQNRVQQLGEELQVLQAQIRQYCQQVDQLAAERAEQQRQQRERPWDALQQQLQQSRAAQARLQEISRQLAADTQRQQQLQSEQQLLLEQLAGHEQQERNVAQRRQARRQADEQAEVARTLLDQTERQAETARQQAGAAAVALQRRRELEQRRQTEAELAAARRQILQQEQALAQAEAARQQWQALQQRALACAITPEQLQHLRRLERAQAEARMLFEAQAARLDFELLPQQTLQLAPLPDADGRRPGAAEALAGQGRRLLTGPVQLQLPGLGTLTIRPAAADLAEREQRAQAAQQALQQALLQLGLADLAAAEARLTQHEALQLDLRLAEQALQLRAPAGIEALQQALNQLRQQLGQAEARLAQLPGAQAGSGELGETAEVLPELAEAERADRLAQQQHEQARQAWQQARQGWIERRSQLDAAERELAAAEALQQDAQLRQRQQQNLARQQVLRTELDALVPQLAHTRAQLQAAQPEIVAQDIERLTRSIRHAEQEQQQRALRINGLESVLQQAGAQGLEEQREQLAGALALAQRRRDELQQRAAALDWLCQRLGAQRQAALARLQAPLQQHLQRYLQLLFPQALLALDEQLVPRALQRPAAGGAALSVGDSGEFAALSFGAREQLGLIVRFAYADLLRAAGRPTLLILDDALVHSDAARLAQMKRVIFDAAQRHQLLLFTCHPELWRDMGVPVRALESLRAAG